MVSVVIDVPLDLLSAVALQLSIGFFEVSTTVEVALVPQRSPVTQLRNVQCGCLSLCARGNPAANSLVWSAASASAQASASLSLSLCQAKECQWGLASRLQRAMRLKLSLPGHTKVNAGLAMTKAGHSQLWNATIPLRGPECHLVWKQAIKTSARCLHHPLLQQQRRFVCKLHLLLSLWAWDVSVHACSHGRQMWVELVNSSTIVRCGRGQICTKQMVCQSPIQHLAKIRVENGWLSQHVSKLAHKYNVSKWSKKRMRSPWI